ncbi:hypothetical protein GO621_18260 [Mucilaginibacter sp. HMF7410]|uniref:Uncharacterized protein n=1 Tax=Mucilaginibacter arboris TaxID=2682090 RepID=A0A7K1T1T4_9SPHI|nr:hypothetical protein [Mucilaginibacter arboris]
MSNTKQRIFIIGKLEVRRFTVADIIILSTFASAVLIQHYLLNNKPLKTGYGLFAISFVVGVQTASSPLGLRFRSIYFSLVWLACCLFFSLNPYSLAKLPLLTFLAYHVIRLVFWKSHDREFIPFEAGRGRLFRHFSKTEGRVGGTKDKYFMKVLMITCFIILIYCMSGMVGVHIPVDK